MISTFQKIQGVGLFCDAQNGANLPLERLTLIYGENARGKSTLSAILASASAQDPSILTERTTIDSNTDPYVLISQKNGDNLKFEKGAWVGDASDLRVFDSEFIKRNVHSGHEVNSDNRKNLLVFALGEKAVEAEARERRATQMAKDLRVNLDLAVQRLLVKSEGMSEDEFTSLHAVDNIEAEIAAAETAVKAAVSRRAILNQPMPLTPGAPELSLDCIFGVLHETLETAHAAAEKLVFEHFHLESTPGFEEWVSEGQKFSDSESCPYCGQGITDRSLIDSYKLYFNEAYRNLKQRVTNAIKVVGDATHPKVRDALCEMIDNAEKATRIWQESGVIVQLPGVSDQVAMKADLANVRSKLLALLEAKRSNLESDGCSAEMESEIRESWGRYWDEIAKERSVVTKTLKAIDDFKTGLKSADVEAEQRRLHKLRLSKLRHSDDVVAEVAEIARLRREYSAADAARTNARQDLKARMDETLAEFGDEINKYLELQFASFRVDKISTNFKGGSPRTEYGILLRERAVDLSGSKKSFSTALSESDKRAMAFAFFLASTVSDPDLHHRVVAVDDPMSSFDRNRRSTTIKLLRDLVPRCAQLIVIAHDPHFLSEIDSGWGDRKILDWSNQKVKIERSHLKLVPKVLESSAEPYTEFEKCDLLRECESKYAKNYRIVSEFVADPAGDELSAAAAVRPLLEGFLHRRYPNLLPANCMFGRAITEIEKASDPSPLTGAQSLVPKMRRIAFFGGDPHHDTHPDAPWQGLSVTEIHGYAREVLSLIHGDE
ncbi:MULTISPECIES: AAA family ATPase [Kocuria]|uniref:AAA family ATPase n=1 Tax=Kocuria TaxID=57493 RepID=UPI000B00DDD4|nr:AAA family ATPase [Kocuria sp. HMSC066H03]